MPFTRQTQFRNQAFPYPFHITDSVDGFKTRESLMELALENRALNNLEAALILELIVSFCPDDESWIQRESSEPTSIWYHWQLASWSPGLVTHRDKSRIVLSSRRRKRNSLGGSPHVGLARDSLEPIFGHWFELLPRNGPSKPPSIINSIEFRRIQNEFRTVDYSFDLTHSHQFFDDIGNRLNQGK